MWRQREQAWGRTGRHRTFDSGETKFGEVELKFGIATMVGSQKKSFKFADCFMQLL